MNNIKDKLIEIAKKEWTCEEMADSIIENLPELLADSEWVRLPCKVGNEVWVIRYYDNKLCKGKICSIIIREIEPLFEINVYDEFGYRVGTIGQTENIFYTKAEAEAKLAELKGVEND